MMNYIIRTKKNINGKRFQTKANDELYHSDGENINQGEFSRKRMNHIIRTEKRKYINRRIQSKRKMTIYRSQKNISKYRTRKDNRTDNIHTYYWRSDGKKYIYMKQKGTNEQGLGRNDQTFGNNNNMIST